jgi:hypothetical protein
MKKILLGMVAFSIIASAAPFNAEVQTYVDGLKTETKKSNSGFVDFDIARGEQIFTSTHIGKKGTKIACTTCHTANLTANGKNDHTGKVIDPLAPSANSARLTNVKDLKKWLRRNFNDVYNREGSAQEKGDVLYYINSKSKGN